MQTEIPEQVAIDIALAYREVRAAEELLQDVIDALERHETGDARDTFGRRSGGLQLGVPSGPNSHRIFNVPWSACKPVIEMHIASQKAIISTLTAQIAASLKSEAV
jgi:hypothetical protein